MVTKVTGTKSNKEVLSLDVFVTLVVFIFPFTIMIFV